MTTVHVVGAGLAGLSCVVRLAQHNYNVILYEAASHAGGRCRSFYDSHLDTVINNGNHLLLSANHKVREYLRIIGSSALTFSPNNTQFPFYDLQTHEKWVLSPNRGLIPWWIFLPNQRVPKTRCLDYVFSIYKLLLAKPSHTVAECLSEHNLLYQRLWHPLVLATLNTIPEQASAYLMRRVFLETFGRGGEYCCPLFLQNPLSEDFVTPALAWLHQHANMTTHFSTRVYSLQYQNTSICGINLASQTIPITTQDYVVLAVPATIAEKILPWIEVPHGYEGILNIHFRYTPPFHNTFIGVLHGHAHWIFLHKNIISVTISAAKTLINLPSKTLALLVWKDICQVLGIKDPLIVPRYRVIKERRATFLQTPDNLRRRPQTTTLYHNLLLAGDWTQTHLPATLEGAVYSGFTAAETIIQQQRLAIQQ